LIAPCQDNALRAPVAKVQEHPRQAKSRVYGVRLLLAYNRATNGITIYVDWAYFLGIVGTLIGIAYHANGCFTQIETTVEWLKEILLEIKERLKDGKEQPRDGLHAPSRVGRRRDLANDGEYPIVI
jgi:hypothetical protein